MERTDYAALHNAPKAFDGVSVNSAINILVLAMANNPMRESLSKIAISSPFIRRDKAYFIGDSHADESILNDASDHVTFALYGTGHNSLTRSASSAHAAATARTFVLVLGFTADKGFIDLHVANELFKLYAIKRSADLVAHIECGFIGAKTHIPLDLKGAYALLAGQHKVHDAEPFAEGLIGVLEDRTDKDGEAVAYAVCGALIAIPMIGLAMLRHVYIAAARANYTIRPAILFKIFLASIFAREKALKIDDGHLVNLGLLGFGHGLNSNQYGVIKA